MQKIIPIFVKAKAWQLFTLLFGVPFVAQFILMFGFMGSMFYSYSQGQEGAEASFNQFMVIFGVIFAIFGGLYMAVFLGWFWSLGCFCNSIMRWPRFSVRKLAVLSYDGRSVERFVCDGVVCKREFKMGKL